MDRVSRAAVALLLAVAGSALAGADVHATVPLPTGDRHSVDASASDAGEAEARIDGQPLEAPVVPDAPSAPVAPPLPEAPPMPAAPSLPDDPAPALPEDPTSPAAPNLPEVPATPTPGVPEEPGVPDAPEVPDDTDTPAVPNAPTMPPMPTPAAPGSEDVNALLVQLIVTARKAIPDAEAPALPL